MLKIAVRLIKGNLLWKCLCLKFHITNSTVILFLTGENHKIDEYALKYLERIMDRKKCEKALVLTESMEILRMANTFHKENLHIKIAIISKDIIGAIYDYYRIVRFNKNLFFTYTDKTKDNLLGKFIRETDVNEKEAVCLALYNFRTVLPE